MKKHRLLFWSVILSGLLLRALGLTRPLLGNFGDYQAGQAMVSKFLLENHFSTWLYPQVNVLVGGSPSLVLLFFPVCSLIAAFLFSLFGGSLDFWGRLQALVFFGAASIYLFRLVARFFEEKTALAALIAFSFSPLTIIYGQSFQNEMATVFFSLVFFYHLVRFLDKRSPVDFLVSSLALSGVLLTRPNGLYLIVPAFYLGLSNDPKHTGLRGKQIRAVVFLFITGLIFPALWQSHIWRLSQTSSHVYMSIFPQLAVRSTFFSPLVFHYDYYRGLLDNLVGVTFTPIGFTLLIVGILSASFRNRSHGFFILWALSFLFSSLLIPRKLIDHNFYLLHLVVPASPLIGYGFWKLVDPIWQDRKRLYKWVGSFLVVSFLVSMRYALHPAFKTPASEAHMLRVAKKLGEVTEKSKSRIIVQGTRTVLYYADRYGWAAFSVKRGFELSDYYKLTNWQNLTPEKRQLQNEAMKDPVSYLEYLRNEEGATHLVITSPSGFYQNENFAQYVHKKYPLVYQEKDACLIFSLSS